MLVQYYLQGTVEATYNNCPPQHDTALSVLTIEASGGR